MVNLPLSVWLATKIYFGPPEFPARRLTGSLTMATANQDMLLSIGKEERNTSEVEGLGKKEREGERMGRKKEVSM